MWQWGILKHIEGEYGAHKATSCTQVAARTLPWLPKPKGKAFYNTKCFGFYSNTSQLWFEHGCNKQPTFTLTYWWWVFPHQSSFAILRLYSKRKKTCLNLILKCRFVKWCEKSHRNFCIICINKMQSQFFSIQNWTRQYKCSPEHLFSLDALLAAWPLVLQKTYCNKQTWPSLPELCSSMPQKQTSWVKKSGKWIGRSFDYKKIEILTSTATVMQHRRTANCKKKKIVECFNAFWIVMKKNILHLKTN